MQKQILSDIKAISSTIDVMIFLLMISISAALLMPVMLPSAQNAAVQNVAGYKFDEKLLQSLLNSRIEGFEYTIEPTIYENIFTMFPECSMYKNNAVLVREHTFRTYADIIAEYMLFSLHTEENGTYSYLHPLSKNYSEATEKIIEEYLNKKIGGRYDYRFEATWQPVPGCEPLSQLTLGEAPPVTAIRQSTLISVPYICSISALDLVYVADDFAFDHAVNSSSKEQDLRSFFNQCMLLAASCSSASIIDFYYPEEYLEQISYREENTLTLGDFLMGSISDDNIEKRMETHMVNNTKLKDGTNYNSINNSTNFAEINIALVKNQLRQEYTKEVYSYLSDELSEEINSTVEIMMQTNDSSILLELRDRQMSSIFRRVTPGGAEISLIIW